MKYKRIVKADAQPVKVLKAPSSKADAEGVLLNEGFEGWDGTTKTGFLPLGAKSILKARQEVTMVARSHGL